jgi:hypothetical protein
MGEQRIEAGTSAITQPLGQHIVDEFVGLAARSSYDRLDNSDGRQQQATTSHFVDDDLGQLDWLDDGLRHGHGEGGQCVEVGPAERSIAHASCQIGEMRTAGRLTTAIVMPSRFRHIELTGDERQDRCGRRLVRAEYPPGPAHIKERHGVAELRCGTTPDQDPIEILARHASGAKADRPGLTEALAYLRPGDTLVVWKLDRLGRSMSHLIEKVGELAARGIGFRSLTENIDTTTPGGMLVFNIFGSLAQFERDLIRERTHAGLKAARERGNKGGRRPVVTPDKLRKARAHIAAGLTVREAAARLKIGKTALYKALENA